MLSINRLSIIVGCLLLAGSTMAIAQDNPPPRERGSQNNKPAMRKHPPAVPDSTQVVQMIEEMSRALSLSAAQKETISDLHFAHFAKVRALVSAAPGKREETSKQRHQLRQEFEKEVRKRLTKAQRTKFDQMVKKHRPRPGQEKAKRR